MLLELDCCVPASTSPRRVESGKLLLVNLGMIWCVGFFFFELLDDCDEESQQRHEALASLDDVGRKLGSVPTAFISEYGLDIYGLGFREMEYLVIWCTWLLRLILE